MRTNKGNKYIHLWFYALFLPSCSYVSLACILELAWQAEKWIQADSSRRNPYGRETRTGSPEKSVGIFIGM